MNTLTKVENNPREVARPEPTHIVPDVDISETKNEYVLEADMPGVSKDGLEVLLEGNELTIVGRRPEKAREGEALHQESVTRDFRRTFVLDPVIDTARISAQMEQGVLTVRLPKNEKVAPRLIKVTG